MSTPIEPSRDVRHLEVRQSFAYPLVHLPGYVALYTLERRQGTVRLVWDGIAPLTRIPPAYRSPLTEERWPGS